MAVRDAEDALDIVQDAMLQLARATEIARAINGNLCSIAFSRTAFAIVSDAAWWRNKLFAGCLGRAEGEEDPAILNEATSDEARGPADRVVIGEAMESLELALRELPARQLQVSLRNMKEWMPRRRQAMGCRKAASRRLIRCRCTHLPRRWRSLVSDQQQ